LSITTLIAAHTVLGLGYVVPLIYGRYIELDKKYIEASLDLGATPWQTFRFIILPLLSPALCAGGLLVFIISFDDFVLSFFCAGGTTQTLPMYIFSLIRTESSPVVSALSTLLLVASSLIVFIFLSLQRRRVGGAR
jgi:spermidine/putrescine transport system permease protein